MKYTIRTILPLCLLVVTPLLRRAEAELAQQDANEPTRPFLIGGDISALPVLEKAGGVYRLDGKPGDCIELLAACGWNCFRLRVFVNPTGRNVVVQDTAFIIELARRIKAAGAQLLLDFHYSDTWADPGNQTKPKAWQDLDLDGLEMAVFEHSRDVISRMRAAGVLPEMVQIGNEIDPGILWPEGKLWGVGDPGQQWVQLGRLLKAGIRGVREGAGGEQVKIVLHISAGGDAQKCQRFFQNIEKQDVPYDTIGLSFYPWWHGTLADLRKNLETLAAAFDKDIFLVETAYPHRQTRWNDKHPNKDNIGFPETVRGQSEYYEQLIRTIHGVPAARVIGIQLWYPESIRVRGVHAWFDGAMAVFDEQGNLLPAARLLGSHSRNEP